MSDKNNLVEPYNLFQRAILLFVRLSLLLAIVLAIFYTEYSTAFFSFLILLLTFVPVLIERGRKLQIPNDLEVLAILFIYASLFLGEIKGYYVRYPWWDTMLHANSGFILGLIGFLILFFIFKKDKIKANPFILSVFSFCFALTIAVLWEIFEFSMDSFLGFNMQKSGLMDTMWDLIVATFGSLIFSIVGYSYFKNKKSILNRLIEKAVKYNS